jgi:hypothetical protein
VTLRLAVRTSARALLALVGAALVIGTAAGTAQAAASSEVVRSYRATVEVDDSGAMHVKETVEYVFSGNDHHGIYRDLRTRFTYDPNRSGSDKVRVYPVSDVEVSSPTGAPDSVEVTAPQAATQVRCYRGERGSTDRCQGTAGPTSTFSAQGLAVGQGMSILLAYPLNTVSDVSPIIEDAPVQGIAQLFRISPLALGLGVVLVAGIGGGMAWLVRRRGRDSIYTGLTPGLLPVSGQATQEAVVTRHPKDVAVQFTPPKGMRPGEIGTLIDEVANPVDVTATIIDLAVRGFLRIEEITNDKGTKVKDWRLVVVLPAPQEQLLPYELELMQALFKGRNEVELKGELRNTFASDLKATQAALYREVTGRGWFRGNPQSVRSAYRFLGIALMVVGFGAAWLAGLAVINVLVPAVAVFLGGLAVMLLAGTMPARAPAGGAGGKAAPVPKDGDWPGVTSA